MHLNLKQLFIWTEYASLYGLFGSVYYFNVGISAIYVVGHFVSDAQMASTKLLYNWLILVCEIMNASGSTLDCPENVSFLCVVLYCRCVE